MQHPNFQHAEDFVSAFQSTDEIYGTASSLYLQAYHNALRFLNRCEQEVFGD